MEIAQESIKNKPERFSEKGCDFCQAPALLVRFRLMESAYHEDMAEVYKRLDELEEKCQNAYAGAEW